MTDPEAWGGVTYLFAIRFANGSYLHSRKRGETADLKKAALWRRRGDVTSHVGYSPGRLEDYRRRGARVVLVAISQAGTGELL